MITSLAFILSLTVYMIVVNARINNVEDRIKRLEGAAGEKEGK